MSESVRELSLSLSHLLFEGSLLLGGLLFSSEPSGFLSLSLGLGGLCKMRLLCL